MELDEAESSGHRLASAPPQADKLDDVVSRVQRLEQAVFSRNPPSYLPQLADVSIRVGFLELQMFPSSDSIALTLCRRGIIGQ